MKAKAFTKLHLFETLDLKSPLLRFCFQFGVSDISGLLQLWQVSSTNASSDAFQVNFCERRETSNRIDQNSDRSEPNQAISFVGHSTFDVCRYFLRSISACWNPKSTNLVGWSRARSRSSFLQYGPRSGILPRCNYRGYFKMLGTYL